MKTIRNTKMLIGLAAVAATAAGALHAAPVINEPFADADSTLNGNAAGTGLTGTWTATTGTYPITVGTGTAAFGPLAISGNRVFAGANPTPAQVNSNASVSAGTTLGTAGLMTDGASLWFSTLYTVPATGSTNSNFGFALGSAGLTSTATLGSGQAAIGFSISRNTRLTASSWNNAQVNGTKATTDLFTVGTTHLIVGQITWGASGETINIYVPGTDLVQPAVYDTVTTAANLDQAASGFNVISFGGKNATATPQGIDEIRFGANYADVVFASGDVTPPTLAGSGIVDDKSGGPILATETVTYTVTFSEAMNPATVGIDDFGNGGSPAAIIHSVTATANPAVFQVSVTPGGAGTLQLQVIQNAELKDLAGNSLNTTSGPISDDTVISVNADTTAPTLTSITDNVSGGPIEAIHTVTYTVTFSEAMKVSTVETADFVNNGSPAATINSVTATANPAVYLVSVTPGGQGTLQLKVAASANLLDLADNALVAGAASPDDTTITVTGDQTPPNPNPMTFAVAPKPASATSITMTATTAVDAYPSNPVQYYFENTTLATNSGWSTSATWTEIGLTEGQQYTYRVKARDAVANETGFSATASAIPVPDTAAPDPSPMTFAAVPAPSANGTISMQASLATDAYGSNPVQYWFENTTNSNNSGWITNRTWSNSGLTDGVSYDYRVKARDAVGNETAFSATASATAKTFTTVFFDDFESGANDAAANRTTGGYSQTPDVDTYTLAQTSKQTNSTLWVRANQGFNSSFNGLIDDLGTDLGSFTDPTGQQAYGFRYSNSGVTTANGVIGTLTTGKTYLVSFDVVKDGVGPGDAYSAALLTFNGAARDDVRTNVGVTSTLATLIGTYSGTTYSTVTLAYTCDGSEPALGHDVAFRFFGVTTSVNIDNVRISVSTGGGGGNPYDTWATGPFSGTLTDPTSSLDFDGGGLATGLEWVLGGDPTLASDDAGIAPTLDNSNPSNLVFTFKRRDGAASDAKTLIAVEYGSNLTGWTTSVNGSNGITIDASAVPAPGFHTVVVTIPKALASGNKLFARLKVAITP